jgi:putative tryptophan/tyrosine transport system substrate-binding protein
VARTGLALLICACSAAAALATEPNGLLVVGESGVEAYAEALDGIRSTFHSGAGTPGLRYVDLQASSGARDLSAALESKETRAVIAIGNRALDEVRNRHAAVPVVAILLLHGSQPSKADAQVDVDISLALQLSAMHALWPGRTRVGIVRNPALSRYSTEQLEARTRKEGFVPVIVDCDKPANLLKSLAALKGKADFAICFPDAELYNAVTIKPLVMASLESRLPLVGFSRAFVRAGAAAGIYADYRDTGRQAVELVERLLRGEEVSPDNAPRHIQVAVNQRVARLLGIDFNTNGALPVEVFR